MKLFRHSLLVVACLVAANGLGSSVFADDFTGYYDVSNWTTFLEGDGSMDLSGAPLTVMLTGSDSGTLSSLLVSFTIAAATSGFFDFDWDYVTQDNAPGFDKAFYLNDVLVQLTNNSGAKNQSGSISVPVTSGDIIGWQVDTFDDRFGAAQLTISNFSAPNPLIIDIKPESFPNSVNLKSKGLLPVAILGSATFDVTDVDIDTLLFGDPNGGTPLSPKKSAFEDVSGNGFDDLSLKFSMRDLVENWALGPDTVEGLLTGALFDGTLFEGIDSIRLVPPSFSPAAPLTAAAPEPSTLALTALGLLGIGWRRRKRA